MPDWILHRDHKPEEAQPFPHRLYPDSTREERFNLSPGKTQCANFTDKLVSGALSLDDLCHRRDDGELGGSYGGVSTL